MGLSFFGIAFTCPALAFTDVVFFEMLTLINVVVKSIYEFMVMQKA